MTGLPERARAWAAEDPDPATRRELLLLLQAAEAGDPVAAVELADSFSGRLEFGTAGLRGALGPGPARMNRVVVLRAAAGLASYLTGAGGTGPVVIGFDARHNSDAFARDTAEVMAGAGIEALVLPRPLPTPVLAYAIRQLGARAGVMVTASHNPPQDNGYKVYLGDGSQIVPPADAEISAAIDAVGAVAEIPRSPRFEVVGPELLADYVEAAAFIAHTLAPRDLRVVYTALHGVGRDVMLDVWRRAGFPDPHVVAEQAEPDPEFPTVAFPNPEEPGAIDLALAAARATGAELVIANDPDADRCAVAVPTRDGDWRMLQGDEVGALLGEHIARRGVADGAVFANSIVSSSLLSRIAAHHGITHTETLTGFKWIARVPGLAYGYEEALGYCVDPSSVQDKDGISAAVLVADLAAELRADGRTLLDLLDELAVRHGVHATDQLSVRVQDLSLITAAMGRLRDDPPQSLGGLAVASVDDLARPAPGPDALPPTDGLRFRLAGGARVIGRPSGTEPKLKCYLEAVVPVAQSSSIEDDDALRAARTEATRQLTAIKSDLATILSTPTP